MLRLVLPKGSLERATLELFAAADLAVSRSSDVDYRASIADPRVDEVRILRPQEIPVYVADGYSTSASPGATGSKSAGGRGVARPARVLEGDLEPHPGGAGGGGSVAVSDPRRPGRAPRHPARLDEYPELTRRSLVAQGIDADVALSYGATEAKVLISLTASSRSPRPAGAARGGPAVIETLLVSHTELIANPSAAADPEKRHAMASS